MFYLDNSPTFGFANDTIDAQGDAYIQVRDSSNNLLSGIHVWRQKKSNISQYIDFTFYEKIGVTNVKGNIKISGLSGRHYYWINNRDTISESTEGYRSSICLYPDSNIKKTVKVNFKQSPISRAPANNIINKYKLSSNYPNPFNSSTTFTYQIPIDDFIEINLYDIQGRLVRKIESGFKPAGQYKISLNFSDLHSGVYFYRLETGNRTITKKCMYLK